MAVTFAKPQCMLFLARLSGKGKIDRDLTGCGEALAGVRV